MSHQAWPADNDPSVRWPIYTRGNVGEVYPDVVLPLEWGLAGEQSEQGWRIGAKAVGFVTDADFDADEPATFVGIFGGYAYFNASLMRLLGVRTPGVSVELIDQQFLGDAQVPPYVERRGDSNRLATARLVQTAVRTLLAKQVSLVDQMRVRADKVLAAAPALDRPNEELWRFVNDALGEHWAFLIGSHVTNSMRAMIASGQLADLCEAKLGDPALALVLASGVGDVRSAGPAEAMWRLAKETEPQDFDDAFEGFLTEFGHRGPNEFSLAGRDWASYPEIAMAAIASLRGASDEKAPAVQQARLQLERTEALKSAHQAFGWQSKRLDWAIASTALWSRAREASKDEVIRAVQPARHCMLELFRRLALAGGVQDTIGPMLLTLDEFESYMADPASMVETIEDRRVHYHALRDHEPPFAFAEIQPPLASWEPRSGGETGSQNQATVGSVLQGSAGAPGVARGRARVLRDPSDPSALEPGDVLIAPLTDPSWTPLFLSAEAVVVEIGAAMSHSMIVSRELGIPCVVGIASVTTNIADGTLIEVDGQAGTVRIIAAPVS